MFWNATEVIEDTRIPAGEGDVVALRFKAPEVGETVKVTVRLLYRRAFIDLARAKLETM